MAGLFREVAVLGILTSCFPVYACDSGYPRPHSLTPMLRGIEGRNEHGAYTTRSPHTVGTYPPCLFVFINYIPIINIHYGGR